MIFTGNIRGVGAYLFRLWVYLIIFSLLAVAQGQTPSPPATDPMSGQSRASSASPPTTPASASAATASEGKVSNVIVEGVNQKDTVIALGDVIDVYVDGVDVGTIQNAVLYLNGIEITGLIPQGAPHAVASKSFFLRFSLETSDTSRSAWRMLMRSPGSLIKKVTLSVGPAGGHALESTYTDAHPISFEIITFWKVVLGVVLFVLPIILFCVVNYCARRYWKSQGLLRDQSEPYNTNPPYSLARVQMAWWFFIILGSFLTITLITNNVVALSNTALILIGITTFTTASANVIQGQKQAAANAAGTQLPQLGRSVGFLPDILSDNTGLSISRYQVVVWTFVLGLIFIDQVYQQLAMPDLDPSILTLMGISSGTYLGFKIAE